MFLTGFDLETKFLSNIKVLQCLGAKLCVRCFLTSTALYRRFSIQCLLIIFPETFSLYN